MQHLAAGGEAGLETGELELVLAGGELGGLGVDLDALLVGIDRADGGADLHEEVLVELAEAGLLLPEAGERGAVAGAVGVDAPWNADGQVELPVAGVAAGDVVGRVVVGAAGTDEAGSAAEVDGGQCGVLGGGDVELELLDGLLGGEVVGLVFAGEFVGEVEGRRRLLVGQERDGAEVGIELELADEGEEGVLGVVHGLLGEDDAVAGVGDADLRGEHVEVGGDAGELAGLVLVVEALGQLEAVLLDDAVFAGEDDVVVGSLGVTDDLEDAAAKIEIGDLDAELAALDEGAVDGGAETAEQRLRDGEDQVAIVVGIENDAVRVDAGGLAVAGEGGADADSRASGEQLVHAEQDIGGIRIRTVITETGRGPRDLLFPGGGEDGFERGVGGFESLHGDLGRERLDLQVEVLLQGAGDAGLEGERGRGDGRRRSGGLLGAGERDANDGESEEGADGWAGHDKRERSLA